MCALVSGQLFSPKGMFCAWPWGAVELLRSGRHVHELHNENDRHASQVAPGPIKEGHLPSLEEETWAGRVF